MKRLLNTLAKALRLMVFAAALARLAGLMPPNLFPYALWTAAGLLVIHSVEVLLFFKYLRLYRGPLAISVVLTLLFGVMHWKPLAEQQAAGRA